MAIGNGPSEHNSLPCPSPGSSHAYSGVPTCARFDPSGRYVFVGTSQSTVLVFSTRTKVVRTFSVYLSSCDS